MNVRPKGARFSLAAFTALATACGGASSTSGDAGGNGGGSSGAATEDATAAGSSSGAGASSGSSGSSGNSGNSNGGGGVEAGDDGSGSSVGSAGDAGADVQVGQPMLVGDQTLPRQLIIENRCTYTVWADALPKTTLPNSVPLEVPSGQAYSIGWPNGWSGRVWGRTGCVAKGTQLTCVADSFVSNSLAEFTLTKTLNQGQDFYDVSLVDGFNIPIGIINVGHTTDTSRIYNCGSPVCAVDLNPNCPAPLGEKDPGGNVVACHNDECKVLGQNDANSPDCKYPNQYTEYFKMACPTSYSFPYDDPTSTFTCASGKDYKVVFCPSRGAQAGLP